MNFHHGKKMEDKCLSFIEDRLDLDICGESVESGLRLTNAEYNVPIRTLRNWWDHFLFWGEYPYETRERKKKLGKIRFSLKRTVRMNNDLVKTIKEIVDEHSEYYLDEIQMALCSRKKVYISCSTIYWTITEKFNYSMQICYESAAQKNEAERWLNKNALECLVSDANQLIFVDKTHKDRNSSRRRKAWERRDSGSIVFRKWFKNTIRYRLLL